MRAIANLDIHGEFAGQFKKFSELPSDPRAGMWAMVGTQVSVCIEIEDGGLPVWFPLNNKGNQFEHIQDTASGEWNITHNLGSDAVVVQCFNDQGKPYQPDSIEIIDANTVQVLGEVSTGKAFVLCGNTDGKDLDSRSSDNVYVPSQTGLTFDNITGMKGSVRTAIAQTSDGRLVTWGNSYLYSRGEGLGSPETSYGFTILSLPYTSGKIVSYGIWCYTGYALFDTGELWMWGDNRTGQCGTGDVTALPIPRKVKDGVAHIYDLAEDVSYWYTGGGRYTYIKLNDGRIQVTGKTGNTIWTDTLDGKDWQDIRLPEGVTFSDINMFYAAGRFDRRAVFLQTNDLVMYTCGRNYHGNLGVPEGTVSEVHVDWTVVPELADLNVEKMFGQYGWYGSGMSCTYLLTTTGELYFAGKSHTSSPTYATGHEAEDCPVNASNQMAFQKVREGIDEIYLQGSPATVVSKENGEWIMWGYSSTSYRVEDNNSAVCIAARKQDKIPPNAKLIRNRTHGQYTNYKGNHFYDEQFMYLRGRNTYGCMGTGLNTDTLKETIKVDITGIFDSKIVDMMIGGYNNGDTMFVLTEKGSIYAAGYGGRMAFSARKGQAVNSANRAGHRQLWTKLF